MEKATSSLSRREVALLGEWERGGISRVTTADLMIALDVDRPAAAVILSRLARKGALDRVGRGIYGVRPMRAVGIPWATPALAAVANLLDGRNYYVGGPVALTTHHLTEQVYHSVIDVFTLDRRPPHALGSTQIVFHLLRRPDLYHLGITSVPIEQVTVQMSDPERALLDLIDRPDLIGSARSALAIVTKAIVKVDVDKMISYAARWPRLATRQRLGYVLERSGVSRSRLVALLAGKPPTHVVPLLVDERTRGPISSPWRVRANVEIDEAAENSA